MGIRTFIHHAVKFSALPKRALRQISTINLQLERLSRGALFKLSCPLSGLIKEEAGLFPVLAG